MFIIRTGRVGSNEPMMRDYRTIEKVKIERSTLKLLRLENRIVRTRRIGTLNTRFSEAASLEIVERMG